MKRSISLSIGVLIVLGIAFAFYSESYSKPNKVRFASLTVNHKILNVGDSPQRIENRAIFVIRNSGNTLLEISDITADCHCTVPTWNKQPIAPGDSTYLSVIYDNHKLGLFQQKITVTSNAIESPTLLVMRGRVIE